MCPTRSEVRPSICCSLVSRYLRPLTFPSPAPSLDRKQRNTRGFWPPCRAEGSGDESRLGGALVWAVTSQTSESHVGCYYHAVQPTISVITISFNDIVGLRRTRNSVVVQKDAKINHIIVDGGSTDGTKTFLSTLDGVDWSSSLDNGRYDAMNRGIARANTDLIWLMHAGDTFGDDYSVAKVLRSYAQEGWSWAYGLLRVMDINGKMIGIG